MSALKPPRWLLVEDNPNDAELLLMEARRVGFQPEWRRVENETEYMRALAEPWDVVLSDYDLPQFSATRALQLLQESGQDIPFIIVSGTIGEETAVAAMRQGAADYLLKDRLGRLGPAITAASQQNTRRREHAQATAELRETQQLFQLLANTVAEVFWVTNADRTELFYLSPGFEKVWGYSCQSLYDDPQSWIHAVHPEDLEKVRQATFDSDSTSYEVEFRIRRADGSERWIHDRSFPFRDDHGQITRVVGVSRDVTEHRRLEAEFRQAQKMEALGRLAAGVAHDFNNLLTVIGGNASLLSLPGASALDTEKCTQDILEAVESAAALTGQLLMFSRKKIMQQKETCLNEVVKKAARMLQRMLGAEIELRCLLSPSLPFVKADSSMLDQVLLNLAVNAKDAMPEGGILTLTTGVTTAVDGAQQVYFQVADTGEGIPAETRELLFQPFFTTKEAGRGTGLGLATVLGIVEQHQGRISLESSPGQGSTFRVSLPVCEAPVPDDAPPTTTPVPVERGAEAILVVDDEPAVRAVLARLLRWSGYTVIEAESGKAALELWPDHQGKISLLVTDMVMPDGITGYELAQRLRAEKPELKVILTSGYSEALASRGRLLDESFGFLQKPYPPQQLLDLIRAQLYPLRPPISPPPG